MALLATIILALAALQIAGYRIAIARKDARYRWGMFFTTMIVYYGWLIYAYHIAEGRIAKPSCGMWILLYYMLGLMGLVMPLTQLFITMIVRAKRRRLL